MSLVTSEGRILLHSTGARQEEVPVADLLHDANAHRSAGTKYAVDDECTSPLQGPSVGADELHSLGVLAHCAGNSQKAVSLIARAIKARPNEPIFYNNYGEAYRALNRFALALTHYEHALAIDPDAVGPVYNLGLVLQTLGRHKEAVSRYEQALALCPEFAEAHNNLGVSFQELDRLEDARVCYERALRDNPYIAEAHNNLGVALKLLGRPLDAIIHHQSAMRLKPEELRYRAAFVECISDLQLATVPAALRNDLIATFSQEGLDPQDLAFAGSSLITHSDPFQALANAIDCGTDGLSFYQLWTAGLSILHADQLFMALLQKAIIRDPSIENVLTQTRKALLHMAADLSSGQPQPTLVSFIYALALQCFHNGYVYAVTERESAELQTLQALVRISERTILHDKPLLLAIMACYIPLGNLKSDTDFTHLDDVRADSGLRELITQQVVQVKEEQRLRADLETLGGIDDGVSRAVRAQYEEHPYPRWLYVQKSEQVSLHSLVARVFPHVPVENVDPDRPDILIPGCGTGQQVIGRSLQIRGAHVLGVDLSLSSLSYAKRKAMELNANNVEFKHADILNLGTLGRSFDMIECIGVLHHMQDPVKGWRILVDLLKPGGFMRVGLYSDYARKSVAAAQLHVAKMGYTPTPDGIRRARQDIFALPKSASIAQVTQIKDFYTMAETRDLLFHVRERRFSLLEIAGILDDFGVTFLGFEFNHTEHKRKYCDRFPDDRGATSLRNWHLYEQDNANAFLGLYLFWVQDRATTCCAK